MSRVHGVVSIGGAWWDARLERVIEFGGGYNRKGDVDDIRACCRSSIRDEIESLRTDGSNIGKRKGGRRSSV